MALPSSFAQIGKEESRPATEGRDRSLWGWVFFSGFVHAAVVGLILLAFTLPVRRAVNYPVYTVDLVGGEKLGGPGLGAQIAPAPQPKESKKAKPDPPQVARVEKEKKVVVEKEKKAVEKQKRTVKEIEKPQKQEKPPEKTATRELSGEMREKLLQAAMERVRQRAGESSAGASASESTAEKKGSETAKKREPLSSGVGEGVGAMAPGSGGRGGGLVKGIDFIVYHNKMLQLIKDRWAWAGRRTNLEVTVRFGIKENGEIDGLRITQRSGDASFDDSVMRAVRSVNPLAPPPEAYRADFSDVELIFRPADLRG
ncbi:MAG: energy transducer TonB [Candidatus Binatia bacterium]